MSHTEIIRAWKDLNYRSSMGEAALAMLPSHPAGRVELPDPTLQPPGRVKGFRIRSGLKAGALSGTSKCSAYGQDQWDDDLS